MEARPRGNWSDSVKKELRDDEGDAAEEQLATFLASWLGRPCIDDFVPLMLVFL